MNDIPGMWAGLWRAMRFAYRVEPRLLVVSFALVVAGSVTDGLGALWLKLLAEGVTSERSRLIVFAAVGLAGSTAAGWVLRTVGGRLQMLFGDRVTIELESHVAHLQASVGSIEHHERPEYLDRLQILKDYAFLLNHLYGAAIGTFGSIARLALTVGLIVSVHPALVVLVLFAVPSVLLSSWRAGVERKITEAGASNLRLARHLFDLGTTAGPGKEVRVTRTEDRLIALRRATWDRWFLPIARARWTSTAWHVSGWALFAAAYVGAIVFVSSVLRSSAGDVLLVLAAGARLSQYIGTTVGEASFFRWTLDAARRLAWLEDYADAHRERADLPAPGRIERGIRIEDVSFMYPGTDKWVLQDVALDLPAGAVVAIVGENGAGKTTLVKLLCKFYEPTSGRITVDGTDLSRVPAAAWRERLAGAFQDFSRFEFHAKRTVGVGDLERLDEVPALLTAVARGGAQDVVTRLPHGLDTQLGPTWDGGVDLSFGQWQKLALARGFMRDRPLLLVLDEPTAALDAETEHALFERFAAQSRAATPDGRITILVSHRFSTVRMADLIVVLDGARVVDYGPHDDLVSRGGLYSELYAIQADAYK